MSGTIPRAALRYYEGQEPLSLDNFIRMAIALTMVNAKTIRLTRAERIELERQLEDLGGLRPYREGEPRPPYDSFGGLRIVECPDLRWRAANQARDEFWEALGIGVPIQLGIPEGATRTSEAYATWLREGVWE